jgi:hypothetical protein
MFSSCYALLSLLKSEYNFEYIENELDNRYIFSNFALELLNNEKVWQHRNIAWHYDIYTIPVRLIYLIEMKKIVDYIYTDITKFNKQTADTSSNTFTYCNGNDCESHKYNATF